MPKHIDSAVPVDTGSANGFALEYGEGTRGQITYEDNAATHRAPPCPDKACSATVRKDCRYPTTQGGAWPGLCPFLPLDDV